DGELAVRAARTTMRSVLPVGRVLTIKGAVGANARADNHTAYLCPEVVATAATAVRAVHLTLGGVDLVTSDPSRSLEETGGAILEVNGTPGLHYHYQVSEPETARSVAIPILERLLSQK